MPFRVETRGLQMLFRLQGDLRFDDGAALYEALRGLAQRDLRDVGLDFSDVTAFDTPTAAAVCEARQYFSSLGAELRLLNLTEKHHAILSLLPVLPPRRPVRTPEPLSDKLTKKLRIWSALLFETSELVVDTVARIWKAPIERGRERLAAIADQAVHLGVNALFIVALLSFLTGVILSFQAAYQLSRFGAEPFMAEIVGLGMVREFAALMTGIILAGRSGAAITAELGTMAVREELDALRTTGIDPISYLVFPRIVAITLVTPALTALSMGIGIIAGLATARTLGLPLATIYQRMGETLTTQDFALGFSKSVLFAWIIGYTGCLLGLNTKGGARSVGRNTTRSVVTAIFLIVVVDSIVTTLWTQAGYGDD